MATQYVRNSKHPKTLEERFEHFNLRLKERYSMEITFGEWKQLSFQGYYTVSGFSTFGVTEIHGVKVLCVQATKSNENYMRTALPYDMPIEHFPLPKEIRQITTKEEFGLKVKEGIAYVEEVANKNHTPRELFEIYPRHIAAAAKVYNGDEKNIKVSVYAKTRFIISTARYFYPRSFDKKAHGKSNSSLVEKIIPTPKENIIQNSLLNKLYLYFKNYGKNRANKIAN